MKIINRYVLKEHVGPFVFALSALTSLMLLQYIARRFGDLVGKGLSWQVITEFFLLSFPFVIAMTLPMAVLVSVLHAFSRLASENEITAMRAGGISSRALVRPALYTSFVLALFMLWFNDRVLPRANHRLATLQVDILRTKPTFALKEQTLNTIKEGVLYLRAGYVARDESGRMRDITIFDLGDDRERRTIYGDSGTLAFAPNKQDLIMHLYHGMILSVPTAQPAQLQRIYYAENRLKVQDVANSFQATSADTTSKGEREMSICEMQHELDAADASLQRARIDSIRAAYRAATERGLKVAEPPRDTKPRPAGGIGALYCSMLINLFHVPAAEAAEVPRAQQPQDTSKKKPQQPAKAAPSVPPQKPGSVFVLIDGQYKKVPMNAIPPNAYIPGSHPAGTAAQPAQPPRPAPNAAMPAPVSQAPATQTPATQTPAPIVPVPQRSATLAPSAGITAQSEITDAKFRIDEASHRRNRYGVEIQKKFSLAAACIVFVLVGAPIALRFPRGGVGVVIGVSFFVFAVYYVGLIGGESLANKGIITPFWAMWADNIIFLIVGIVLMSRMGREGVTGRGGTFAELLESARDWRHRRRAAGAGDEAAEARA